MNSKMKSTDEWDRRRGKIVTSIGKWTGGQDIRLRSYSLLNDLFMKKSYMQIMALNVTGRLISPALATWLENNFITMSYPDARIWCNQIGALAGTMHTSPTAAVAAGCLGADSRAYGGSLTSKLAMQYIMSALERIRAGASIYDLINEAPLKNGRPSIIGFARPVAKDDERITPHRQMSASLGFTPGGHMTLAEKLSEHLTTHFGMGINIGGYTAAFMADQGFSPDELYNLKSMCVASGVMACYIDQLHQPFSSFLPLRCTDVDYQGAPARTFPPSRHEAHYD